MSSFWLMWPLAMPGSARARDAARSCGYSAHKGSYVGAFLLVRV